MKVKTLVLTGYGINCEQETASCFSKAGSQSEILHINQLIRSPQYLDEFHLLALPGGFSFGDHVASGKIFANKLKYFLKKEIQEFIQAGKGIIGICNGFQILIKAGLLPGENSTAQQISITHNEQGKFEDRWVQLKINLRNSSFWLQSPQRKNFFENEISEHSNKIETDWKLTLPIRHGEGRVVIDSLEQLKKILDNQLIAITYQDELGNDTMEYPANPNGSISSIAGMTNSQGNVFGLMPHPEAFRILENAPNFQVKLKRKQFSENELQERSGSGMTFFYNGVNAMKKKFNLE